MDQNLLNILSHNQAMGATRTRVTYTEGRGTGANRRETEYVLADVEHPQEPSKDQLQARHRTPIFTENNDPHKRPHVTACACLEVPATPVTLPWLVPNAERMSPQSVAAVGVIHKTHTMERMRMMVPYLEERCAARSTTPIEVARTLMALHNIHKGGNQSHIYNSVTRMRALAVAQDMYGTSTLHDPADAVEAARKQPWTRTIIFSGDVALTALATTTLTGTTACATYMCGVWAGAKMGSIKAAATVGGKMKAGTLAVAGVAGTTLLGVGTTVAGTVSVVWWVSTISAYRDVWDNDFARDAYFFHKMRDHHVLPSDPYEVGCHHRDGSWTSITNALVVGKRGIRWN